MSRIPDINDNAIWITKTMPYSTDRELNDRFDTDEFDDLANRIVTTHQTQAELEGAKTATS